MPDDADHQMGFPLPPMGRTRICYDATHIVSFGLETPVGVARVDQYVAEFMARDPDLEVQFLVFDAALCAYRVLTHDETALVAQVLFHRYEPDMLASAARLGLDPKETARLSLSQVPEPSPGAAVIPRGPANTVLRRLVSTARLPPAAFDRVLTQRAGQLFPVTERQNPARRLTIRIVRRIGLALARGFHVVAHGLIAAGQRVVRPDPVPPIEANVPPVDGTAGTEVAMTHLSAQPPPSAMRFLAGSVVICIGNCWDYMDYAYLHRICHDRDVRFVCIVYDVIAMQLPYTTPGPQHIYHRHWVEIGHCAAHLLAISRFTVEQYTLFIAEPNGLSPPMSHAYLPDFLRERADEIGETPVPRLIGRRFVMFCSTIETRKNHQLLLQLWDRLRLEFDADDLPILVFVGKWGWGTETVRLLSERNFRLRDRLLILDRVTDAELIWIYRNARFTLFPALSEGYGLGAAESLSFGTPVVVATCPALIEATEGLMPAYDPLDFPAWMNEMRALIRDDRRLAELCAAAARYRGPAYDSFAGALRAIAVEAAQSTALIATSD